MAITNGYKKHVDRFIGLATGYGDTAGVWNDVTHRWSFNDPEMDYRFEFYMMVMSDGLREQAAAVAPAPVEKITPLVWWGNLTNQARRSLLKHCVEAMEVQTYQHLAWFNLSPKLQHDIEIECRSGHPYLEGSPWE